MSHYSDINYDDFFQTTTKLLQKNLPAELRQFKTSRRSNSGWIVVRYPQFKNSQYELHLSSRSTHHAEDFGVGPHVTSAFYYRTKFGDSDAWLEVLASFVEHIEEQLSKRVVIGPWGENWVWIAESLDVESLTSENISFLFAQFIQATYKPISSAFEAIGR
jgi:hypothetical protein